MAVTAEKPATVAEGSQMDSLPKIVAQMKPSLESSAQKSILKRRLGDTAQRGTQHARVVLPNEAERASVGSSCVIDLGGVVGIVSDKVKEGTKAKLIPEPDLEEEEINYRELELACDKEPEELDMRLLWLAREGDWVQVDELLSGSKRQESSQLKALATVVSEGSKWSMLHFAAKENKWQLIEKLVSAGLNPNQRADESIRPLHLAAIFLPTKGLDCDATIRSLISWGADPSLKNSKNQLPLHIVAGKASNSSLPALNLFLAGLDEVRLEADSEGNIALFEAIRAGNLGAVQDLLIKLPREQLHFKRLLDDQFAIHMAIKQKDIEILKVIIDAGCNLNLQNGKGQTGLHLATEKELEEFVRLLCQAGADPDVLDNENKSALAVATLAGNHKIMDILTDKYSASVLYRTRDGSTLMHLAASADNGSAVLGFIKRGIPIHMPNKEGVKCIHVASVKGHVEVVKAIVAKGSSVDSRTKDGYSPLHLAVKFGKYDLVEALLGLGAELQLKTVEGGSSALHLATQVSDGQEIVDLLIRSGADLNALDFRLETPSHVASRAGNTRAVQLILEEGAEIDIQNEEGENILHVSVSESNLELVSEIIRHIVRKRKVVEAKRLINQPNKKGETSLHYAASLTGDGSHNEDEDRDIARCLLINGGDSFIQTKDLLQTAVHYCCQSGNTRVLQEILSHLDQQSCRVACNKPAAGLWTPLFYACYNGHPEIIKMLINQTARIDVFDENGEAPLHVAVSRGHQRVVDILLEHNAFVNVRNKPGMTPLHIAAKLGYNSMVTQLITEHGAILDAMTLIKQIPLHLSAENGQLEVCKTLLSLGSDLNGIDNQSQTPLHLTARKNHAEVLKLFLSSKPELVSLANKNGYNCAHIAALNGSVDAIKELLRFDRDNVINARIKKTNSTALHLASENGNAEIVKLLLISGAKANDENGAGETCLHLAAKNGHVKILHTIRNSDWKLCSRRNGLTALHVASNCGQTEFVAEMLRCRVPGGIRSERSSLEPNSDFGLTPLHLACRNGHEGVVRMLLNSAGVQVDSASEIDKTIPVHLAAQGGHLLVAGLLISRSLRGLTQTDAHERSALHFAAAHGHRDMVALLIGQGAQMDSQDDLGLTPVQHAAKHGFLEVVELLVESGADPTLPCLKGKVPICTAAAAGHKRVISYLLKKDHDAYELMQDKAFLIDLMACNKQHQNQPIQEFILANNDQAPIDVAVKLAKCYESLAERDKDRARDLVVARDLCDQVATDLLTIVASMNNSTALLKSYDRSGVEFLDVLLELDRKDVVSQHSVQRYLSDLWLGRLSWQFYKFVLLFFGFLLLPPLWVAVSCPAGHDLATIPAIKFMSYLVSHIFFIFLLALTTINPWLPVYKWTNLLPPFHEWLLLLWFCGNLSTTLSNPPDKAGFGSIKLVNLFLGFLAISVHLVGIFLANELIPYILFTRNQLLASVLLLSFVELLNFLTFHHLFGPWAVIIQDLMKDMMRFLVIMAIFLIGFALNVTAIYTPVLSFSQQTLASFAADQANRRKLSRQQEQLEHFEQEQQLHVPSPGLEFQSPVFTFEMLFYSLFGLVEPDQMPPMHSSPAFASVIMKFTFGIYMLITVVVLINSLIAMMSNTYQRIEARSDVEWKFGRAKLIRNMIRTSATPSPLILLMGLWLEVYQNWKKKQAARKKVKQMAFAAFNTNKLACQVSRSEELALKAGRVWMSKTASVKRRLELAAGVAGASDKQLESGQKFTMTDQKPSTATAARIGQMPRKGSLLQPASICQMPEANVQGSRINQVVSWPSVVRKYWDSVGIVPEREEGTKAGSNSEQANEEQSSS